MIRLPDTRNLAALREAKAVPANYDGTEYAASVRLLARKVEQSGSSITLVVLPFNKQYYKRLGLDADLMQARREWATAPLMGPRTRVLRPVFGPQDYYDSIHYTDAGRAKLAAFLCDHVWQQTPGPQGDPRASD